MRNSIENLIESDAKHADQFTLVWYQSMRDIHRRWAELNCTLYSTRVCYWYTNDVFFSFFFVLLVHLLPQHFCIAAKAFRCRFASSKCLTTYCIWGKISIQHSAFNMHSLIFGFPICFSFQCLTFFSILLLWHLHSTFEHAALQ